jgi:hypothetical protein
VTRMIPVLLLLAASAAAQASETQGAVPKTKLVLDNPTMRVYRATIPAHSGAQFQVGGAGAEGKWLVLRLHTAAQ